MMRFYLFSLVVGGGLLLFSLFGDFGDHESPGAHGDGHDAFKLLSLRTATYFLFGFGATGAALSWAWGTSSLLVLVLAIAVGIAVGGSSAAVFKYLRREESGERQGDLSFVGLAGRVTIPLSSAAPGKVLIRRGDRSFELLARPFGSEVVAPDRWTSVVVVEMQNGTAIVAPLEETAAAET